MKGLDCCCGGGRAWGLNLAPWGMPCSCGGTPSCCGWPGLGANCVGGGRPNVVCGCGLNCCG